MQGRLFKIQAGMAATGIAALLMPAVASARPRITTPPTISGEPTVGKTVTATGYQFSGGSPSWAWYRCQSVAFPDGCTQVPKATASSYAVSSADVGEYLRVLLVVDDGDGHRDWRISNAVGPVKEAPKPPPPPPTPTPTPTVTPTASPSVTPAPSATPPPSTAPAANPIAPPVPAGAVLHATARRTLKMMRPAPVIRVRGRTTPGGARITLLTVRAPGGAAIGVSCRGRSCPVKRWAHATSLTRLVRFQRALAAGTKLTIRVTKPGRIGKYTEIVIRRDKAPWRRDRCLNPGARNPRRCPSV